MTRAKVHERVRAILTRANERHREHLVRLRASAARAPVEEGRRVHSRRGGTRTQARLAGRRMSDVK